MDDEDNDYEIERQRIIAENRLLLSNLGLDPSGAAHLNFPKPPPKAKPAHPSGGGRKRKSEAADVAPRRRSGRIAGLEAEGEELAVKVEEERKAMEAIRVINRKEREQRMELGKMVEDESEEEVRDLETYLQNTIAPLSNPRKYPSTSTSSSEAYAEKDTQPAELARLKDAFRGMSLRANAKVTSERVFSMVVHPEKSKTVVLVGDKYGGLGIWDALGPAAEQVKDEDDTSGIKEEDQDESEGRVWRVQAHARNSITAMKVDPVNGSGLFSSSYDCSLRHLDFSTLISSELFAFTDEDMLVTHFDLVPSGQEAWIADKNGGISHCDFREGKGSRRRWVVQEEGRAAKLGGMSVNPLMPHLIVTAGNDQHVRIWDTRHLLSISPRATDNVTPPPPALPVAVVKDGADEKPSPRIETWPSSSIPYDRVAHHMESKKGHGLLRASYQHGKSCSAAYWDPWGRRVLTTSYDDKLRIWTLNPQSLLLDQPLAPTHFQPSRTIPHNCQTGRWLTILRAQWSLNMDYMPHFTVGNMKRSLDVVAATGDKIVSLWTDAVTAVPAVTASHPSLVDHVVGGNTSGRIQLWAASG